MGALLGPAVGDAAAGLCGGSADATPPRLHSGSPAIFRVHREGARSLTERTASVNYGPATSQPSEVLDVCAVEPVGSAVRREYRDGAGHGRPHVCH